MKPDSVQLTCCTQVGSTAANVNGTLGCPYNAAFSETDANQNTWLACCKTNNCDSELCTDGGLDTPYPSSSSSASDTGSTAVPSAIPKPNSGLPIASSFQAIFARLLLLQTLVSVLYGPLATML